MIADIPLDGPAHRVGYAPDPWAWVPWEYVERSTGRWDDPQEIYRVLYAGSSPEACFIEVLAQFRPDADLLADMAAIEPDPRDEHYPTIPPGQVHRSWLDNRRLGSGTLAGTFADIPHRDTIAALRPHFLARAIHFGLPDFDAGAIRMREPRGLTREVSRFLYALDHRGRQLDGIGYESRFGAGLQLWAVFERAEDSKLERSRLLTGPASEEIATDHPGLLAALELHGLELT
jgi:hypothetical protein